MKTIYKSFKGTILNGTNEASIFQDIDAGKVVVGCLFAGVPSKDVSLKILDASGSAIIEASNYEDWQQRQGGDYLTSKKPLGFSGSQKIKVVATSIDNQTANWNFEVLLIIQQDNTAGNGCN